jgi:hypothetical protein
MKSINKVILITGLVAISATACQKVDFGTVNESKDVRDSRIPSTDKLFTNVILSTANFAFGTNIGVEPCLYVQYLMESQYTEGSRYATTNADWAGLYAGPLKDLDKITKVNTDPASASDASVTANGSNANQIATARILKAYLYALVSDRWGDVPYSKALNGEVNLTPVYDKQQELYIDLLKELKEAVAQYDNGAGIKGDPIYNGSVNKWKRLGNSLRMILAMRIVKADATKARTEFVDAFNNAAGYIGTNADNFFFSYPDVLNFRTPWNALYDKRDDYGLSKYFVDYLISTNDLRLTVYAQRNRSGNYVGIPFGLDRNATIAFTGATDYSRMGEQVIGRTKNGNTDINLTYAGKGYMITAAQMLSSVAEAASRGWITNSATTAYSDAIAASWDQWGITYTPTQLNTYVNGTAVTLAGQSATEVLKRISTQRWVILYPNGSEAWSEWRRTGYPVLTPAPQAVNASRQIPRRYGYPLNEPLANPTNYAAAVAGIGGIDGTDVRVWWDK